MKICIRSVYTSNILTGKHVLLVHKQTTHGSCKIHHHKDYRPVYLKADIFQNRDLQAEESVGVGVALITKTGVSS